MDGHIWRAVEDGTVEVKPGDLTVLFARSDGQIEEFVPGVLAVIGDQEGTVKIARRGVARDVYRDAILRATENPGKAFEVEQ